MAYFLIYGEQNRLSFIDRTVKQKELGQWYQLPFKIPFAMCMKPALNKVIPTLVTFKCNISQDKLFILENCLAKSR